jgi:hypothetical protein
LLYGSEYLCNACGLRYKKGKFCPICFKVYYDADTNQMSWRQCSSCLNWTHKKCLQKLYNKEELISSVPYTCRCCKKEIT